jgi:hypothetical protein
MNCDAFDAQKEEKMFKVSEKAREMVKEFFKEVSE